MVKVTKKMPYYIFGAIAIFCLASLGPLRIIGDGAVSVAAAVALLPGETLRESSAGRAFESCATSWMYVLLAVTASLPSASYVYEELASRFYMAAEQRMGKYRYLYSRLLYSAASGWVLAAAGLAAYAAAVLCIFPLNPAYAGSPAASGEDAVTLLSFLMQAGLKILYMASFAMAMSMLATSLVFLCPDLYACLGILFIIGYLLKETALDGRMSLPAGIAAAAATACGILWKAKGGRA